ncbi:hypothetical protein KEM54_002285 [Ascosphaera aggregata]|nr:hypothetical protein KEM54_002285 [Ascosphaera aggregata]
MFTIYPSARYEGKAPTTYPRSANLLRTNRVFHTCWQWAIEFQIPRLEMLPGACFVIDTAGTNSEDRDLATSMVVKDQSHVSYTLDKPTIQLTMLPLGQGFAMLTLNATVIPKFAGAKESRHQVTAMQESELSLRHGPPIYHLIISWMSHEPKRKAKEESTESPSICRLCPVLLSASSLAYRVMLKRILQTEVIHLRATDCIAYPIESGLLFA